jgi:hypothetical protein
MTMEMRCPCGEAELVEPDPWNWAEAIGLAMAFLAHLEEAEHDVAELKAILASTRELLERWGTRALLAEHGHPVIAPSKTFVPGFYLAPKVTRAENWTGKPEQVLPPREKGADPP